MNFTVRRAQLEDLASLRDLRIQALTESPTAFSSTVDIELARAPETWRRWLTNGATFLLTAEGRDSGIAAGLPDKDDPSIVYLVSMWVHPSLRGSGAAEHLVAAVKEWAVRFGASQVRLLCVRDNIRAGRFYERVGFRSTGKNIVRERDGAIELELACQVERRARRGALIIVCGLPGSGKTTHARQLESARSAVRLCPDEWMQELAISVWDETARARVEALQWKLAQRLLTRGMTVVLEWGTWARQERETLRAGAQALGASAELHYLAAPVDMLFDRLQHRGAERPAIQRKALEEWAAAFEVPDEEERALFDQVVAPEA